MGRYITPGPGGIVDVSKIITVASARSAPIKRLLMKTGPERIINLTYGYPRESVLVMEGGYLVLVSVSVEQLSDILGSERRYPDEPAFK